MGYIENNLNSKEKLVVRAKNSWWALLPQLIWAVILTVLMLVLKSKASKLFGEEVTFAPWVWGIYVIIGFLPVIVRLLTLLMNTLCVTTKRCFGRKGILKRDTLDAPLAKIDTVSIKQTFWGRIFNFAFIVIKTTSSEFKFPLVADVQKFKNILMEEIDKEQERAKLEQAQMMADALKLNK